MNQPEEAVSTKRCSEPHLKDLFSLYTQIPIVAETVSARKLNNKYKMKQPWQCKNTFPGCKECGKLLMRIILVIYRLLFDFKS